MSSEVSPSPLEPAGPESTPVAPGSGVQPSGPDGPIPEGISPDDIVPARMINEWFYCPRLAYLEWVEGEWRSNQFTEDGRRVHRRVDRGANAPVPAADEVPIEAEQVVRSLKLSAPQAGIIMVADVVELEGKRARPVDYKRGHTPDRPERAWPSDIAQVVAQAIALRESGYECHEGVVYYAASKERVSIQITPARVADVLAAADALREAARSQRRPPPLVDSPKCDGCSLAPICLPDELHRLRALGLAPLDDREDTDDDDLAPDGPTNADDPWLSAPELAPLPPSSRWAGSIPPRSPDLPPRPGAIDPNELGELEEPEQVDTGELADPEVRILFPPRDEGLPLHVSTAGARVRKKGHELLVTLKDDTLGRARIPSTSSVSLYGAVHPTTPALVELLWSGISVHYFSSSGWHYGYARGFTTHGLEARRAQYRWADDEERRLALARRFVSVKISNQRVLLRRNARPAQPDALVAMKNARDRVPRADTLEQIMGREGEAASAYFRAFSTMIRPRGDLDGTFHFEKRNRRPPTDAVNALLSFSYAQLTKVWVAALLKVGLDPMLGFLHVVRSGRPSLALDCMEEFRPVLADSLTLQMINTGEIAPGHFVSRGPAVNLNDHGRKKVISAWEQRLDTLTTHPVFGYRLSWRKLIDVQAQLLARHLQGEIDAFPAILIR